MADPTPGSGLNSLDSSPFIITPSIFGRALSSAENSRGNSRSNSDEKLEEIQIDIINPHQEEEHGKTQTIQATHSPPAPQTTPVPPAEKKLSPMTVHLSLSPISQAHTTELVDDEFLSDPACSSEDAASTTDLPTDFRLPMTKHTHRDHSKYPLMSRENPRIQSSVRQMIESCRKQKGFTRLAIYAVTCLKNHAIDEASAEDLIREGVLDFLLEVLSDHPDHEGLVSIINECIGSLNRSERLASLITERLKHESSLPFLSPLRGFQKPQSIITACKTISHLFSNSQSSQNNNYVNVLVNAGLYTTMSGVAKTFHTNQKVIESISSILRQSIVVSGDESARSAHQLIETGMVAKIIQSFSHISDHAAAIEPLRLLENIATVDKVSLKYLKTLGTMDASIAVLNRFQSNRDIAKAGADLLSVLSTNKVCLYVHLHACNHL